MHYYLLEDIVEKFGCIVAKEVLQKFNNQNYDHKKKINGLPGPITEDTDTESIGNWTKTSSDQQFLLFLGFPNSLYDCYV